MVLFVIFGLVVLLWIVRSLVICTMGVDWYIERNHSDKLKTTDRAIITVKVIGLVFLAFVQPIMFFAGSVAAFFIYCFVLRSTVNDAYGQYAAALKALDEQAEAKATD